MDWRNATELILRSRRLFMRYSSDPKGSSVILRRPTCMEELGLSLNLKPPPTGKSLCKSQINDNRHVIRSEGVVSQ